MKKNNITVESMLRKANYRIGSNLNEAKYSRIDLSEDDFDSVPEMDDSDIQPDENIPMDTEIEGEPPAPEFDMGEPDENIPIDDIQNEPEVDDIQNEIIKHNTEAMRGIHDQMENLTNLIQSLSTKFESLSANVEEVREPSNVEKLMNQKEHSFPFNTNLNDYWGGNWYQEKQNTFENGIRELPDGTFIANFDDLPKQNHIEIDKSFDY